MVSYPCSLVPDVSSHLDRYGDYLDNTTAVSLGVNESSDFAMMRETIEEAKLDIGVWKEGKKPDPAKWKDLKFSDDFEGLGDIVKPRSGTLRYFFT